MPLGWRQSAQHGNHALFVDRSGKAALELLRDVDRACFQVGLDLGTCAVQPVGKKIFRQSTLVGIGNLVVGLFGQALGRCASTTATARRGSGAAAATGCTFAAAATGTAPFATANATAATVTAGRGRWLASQYLRQCGLRLALLGGDETCQAHRQRLRPTRCRLRNTAGQPRERCHQTVRTLINLCGGLSGLLTHRQVELRELLTVLLRQGAAAFTQTAFQAGQVAIQAFIHLRTGTARALQDARRRFLGGLAQGLRAFVHAAAQALLQPQRPAPVRWHGAARSTLHATHGALRFLLQTHQRATGLAVEATARGLALGIYLRQVAASQIAQCLAAVARLVTQGAARARQRAGDRRSPLFVHTRAFRFQCIGIAASQSAYRAVARAVPLGGLGGAAVDQLRNNGFDPSRNARLTGLVLGAFQCIRIADGIVGGTLITESVERNHCVVSSKSHCVDGAVVCRLMTADQAADNRADTRGSGGVIGIDEAVGTATGGCDGFGRVL
ncbi:hypothetical protein [Hydrogenophaga sp.]|uniref:hypothetical protein n=1 Tax=Hydrogenophaga sp. TaxID=1904254 RepID=UPI0025BE5740|nr:hypothetical protein [Hydrogenophaga sp.]